jgi:Domain of unknown function (DUF222)/HNH endonuclease
MFASVIPPSVMPPPVMSLPDVLEELEAAVDKVARSEQALDAARLHRLVERLDALRVRAVGELDRSGAFVDDGYPTAAAWVRARCRVSHGAAQATVTLARKLGRLQETAVAFGDGEISRQHASLIAEACTPAREAAIVELEPQLVAAARVATPKELYAILRRVTDALDGDGGLRSDEAQYARRRLHLSRTLDGMVALDGLLDPETGETALTALQALMRADHPGGDTRTTTQRRADAFAQLCRLALERGWVGTTRGVRPHVSAVVDLPELERRGHYELVAQIRADTAHGGRLSPATLERLTCECAISRIITDGPSRVLDVGRATPTIPPAIWKALVVRDRHCQGAGCTAPPGWCQGHHLWHWTKGGPTALHNLKLLCDRCHRKAHADEYRRPKRE